MHTSLNLNNHAGLSSEARGLNCGLSLHLHPYFVYVQAVKALANLHIFAGFSEPSWLENVISTKISCAK